MQSRCHFKCKSLDFLSVKCQPFLVLELEGRQRRRVVTHKMRRVLEAKIHHKINS